jgi:hypothetical protein
MINKKLAFFSLTININNNSNGSIGKFISDNKETLENTVLVGSVAAALGAIWKNIKYLLYTAIIILVVLGSYKLYEHIQKKNN